MGRYLAGRVLQIVITFFLFLTAIYFLIDAQPGSYANIFLGDPRLTAEQRQTLSRNLGLDQPTWMRYLIWMRNFFRGDFGTSFSNYPRPVLDVIRERAPRTILLFTSSTILSFYMGFIAGKMLAWRRGKALEYVATIGGVILYTIFLPWFALLMVWFFAYTLDIFPIGKFVDPMLWRDAPVEANYVFIRMLLSAMIASLALFVYLLSIRRLDPARRAILQWLGVGVALAGIVVYWVFFTGGVARYAVDILWHLLLPIITLTIVNFAGIMLLMRNSMLETLREDYILAARAKGLSDKVVRDKHAARNALLPVVTSFVFGLATVLNGGVITETIFSWPGMGLTLLAAAGQEDIPMAVGALVFISALTLLAHLAADILYAYLDPRIRYA